MSAGLAWIVAVLYMAFGVAFAAAGSWLWIVWSLCAAAWVWIALEVTR